MAIFTKEMFQKMFDTCTIFDAPCKVIERFSNVSVSLGLPIVLSEHWSALS